MGQTQGEPMATNKTVERPSLQYVFLASWISINKLQIMQNAAFRAATGCTQDTNIQHLHDETLIHEHCSSTHHNSTRKHNIHNITYIHIQHTSTKPTTFNNARYTTNIPRDPDTVTATDIKTSMRHIHTSIVFRHPVTRVNNKILCTPPPHIIRFEETLSRLTRRTIAQLRTTKSPFLKSYLQKVDPTHIYHHYAPFVTPTHTTRIIYSTAPTYAPRCELWIYGHTSPE